MSIDSKHVDCELVETRVCRDCQESLPITRFHNHKGYICNACYAKQAKKRRRIQLIKQLGPVLVEFESRIRQIRSAGQRKETHEPTPRELLQDMSDKAGGSQGVADLWWDQLQISIKKNPGSKTVLDQIWKFMTACQAASQSTDPVTQVAQLTDEQLESEMLAFVAMKMPEMLRIAREFNSDCAKDALLDIMEPEQGDDDACDEEDWDEEGELNPDFTDEVNYAEDK